MGAQFPGANNAEPGVYSEVVSTASGVSSPNGLQIACIMGEGARFERIVNSAVGNGKDGWNSTYSSTLTGQDGRHFLLSNFPIQTNRMLVAKNGVTLVGLEQAFSPTSSSFSSTYDYRININNGRLELQTASLVDLGGDFYLANSINSGNGDVNNLTLQDVNAPTETWTIRCTSVRRDGYGNAIPGFAKFIAQGSVSGVLKDGYGNVVSWQSDDVVVSNGILSFSISEGGTAFIEGDRFTVKVKSGALLRGDSLTISYIAIADINSPQFFADNDQLQAKHGRPSLDNTLSLGAQIAFANTPPGVYAMQCAPPVPRRLSYSLEVSASGADEDDDLMFSLPLNVLPDANSNINFFVYDPATEIETQIIPNKVAYFDPAFTTSPSAFIQSGSIDYSYTVVLEDSVIKQGDDAILNSVNVNTVDIESDSILFNASDVGKGIKLLSPAENAGTYTISAVNNGLARVTITSHQVEAGEIEFEVIDTDQTSAKILFTQDLALATGQSLRATIVDTRDANFYDAGWTAALEALESLDDISLVVALPKQTISAIFQNVLQHCETMSNIKNKRERRMYCGAIAGLTPDNLTGQELAAVEDLGVLEGLQGDTVSEILDGNVEDLANYSVPDAFGNSYRSMYYYPDQVIVQVGADRVLVDGFYAAAAGAGFESALSSPVVPQTNKVLKGITIPESKKLSPTVREALLEAGVCVLKPVAGGAKVVWGKTTSQSGSAEEEEDSIVAIRDIIAKSGRTAMEPYIGLPEDPSVKGTLSAKFEKFLGGLVSSGLITRYSDVRVSQNLSEPRQWDFTVKVRPRYPINWIYIRFNIGAD